MRLFRTLSVLAAVGVASLVGVGLKFPVLRVRAQNAAAAAPLASAVSSKNVPATIVANTISSRSLALAPATITATQSVLVASEPSILYLNSIDHANQIFSFAVASSSTAAKTFASIVPEGVPTFTGASIPANVSQLALIAGAGPSGSSGDGGKAASAEFDLNSGSLSLRSGIAVGSDGTVYIADTNNSTIRSVAGPASSEPAVVRSVAGRWAPSQDVQLSEPLGIALDRSGNLYIADRAANAVDVLFGSSSPKSGQLETLASVATPSDLAVTPDGRTVFVSSADTGTVEAINTQTRAVRDAGIVPASLFSAALVSFSSVRVAPQGLATDGAGNLFVAYALTSATTAASAASNSDQILRLDAFTAKVTVGARALNEPGEIAFDTNGNLFVSNQGSRQILKFAAMGVPATGVSLTPPGGAGSITDFGDVPVGGSTDATALQSFQLSNNTSAALTNLTWFTAGGDNGDFTITNTSCLATLPAGQSCNFNVSFTPTQNATSACVSPINSEERCTNLSVNYNGESTPLTAALTGTADDFDVECVTTTSVVCVPLSAGGGIQITIPAGYYATFPMQIVPDSVFNGPVTLTCPSNLPASPTGTLAQPTVCGISSGTSVTLPLVSSLAVNVTAGTPAPFSLTFQTTNSKGEQCSSKGCVNVDNPPTSLLFPGGNGPFDPLQPNFRAPNAPATASSGSRPVFFGLVLLVIVTLYSFAIAKWNSQRRRALVPLFALSAAVVIAASVTGCHHYKSPSIGFTPAGTYNLTVTGTAQNASRGYTVTLIVTGS